MKIQKFVLVVVLLLAATAELAAQTTLNAVLYPEGEKIDVKFDDHAARPQGHAERQGGGGAGAVADRGRLEEARAGPALRRAT